MPMCRRFSITKKKKNGRKNGRKRINIYTECFHLEEHITQPQRRLKFVWLKSYLTFFYGVAKNDLNLKNVNCDCKEKAFIFDLFNKKKHVRISLSCCVCFALHPQACRQYCSFIR